MAEDKRHTIKEELKDLYEYVRPIPKLNIPELQENECVKPKDNDYEYIYHVSPASRRNQACDECGSLYYHGDGKYRKAAQTYRTGHALFLNTDMINAGSTSRFCCAVIWIFVICVLYVLQECGGKPKHVLPVICIQLIEQGSQFHLSALAAGLTGQPCGINAERIGKRLYLVRSRVHCSLKVP